MFTRTYAKPHGYAAHYDKLFTPLRDKPVKLLEIGAAGGEGILMWLDYFGHPDARIFGVDIVSNTNPWNTPSPRPDPRYEFCQGDQSSDVFWQCFVATFGKEWDIVIDDGGHYNDGIITSHNALWPHVKPGGFYAVEDLGCSYGPGSIFVKPGFPDHMEWLRLHIDMMMQFPSSDIDSIYLSRELAVFKKKTTT